MSNQLKTIRNKRGLSVLALSVKASISTNTLVAVEKYSHSPRTETKAKIANALGVRISNIWRDEKLPLGLVEADAQCEKNIQDAAAIN